MNTKPAEQDPGTQPPSPYQTSSATLRETLKWLTAALAAVGAVLVGGLSLGSLGSAEGARLAVAIVGLGVALLCISVAVFVCAMGIQAGVHLTPQAVADDPDLKEFVQGNEALAALLPDRSIEGLIAATTQASKEQMDAVQAANGPGATAADRERLELVQSHMKQLNQLSREITTRGQFFTLRRSTRRGGVAVVLLALIASAGIIAFAWGANPPPSEQASWPTLVRTPTEAELTLDRSGRQRLENELGKACVAGAIPATVIEDLDNERYRLAVHETPDCQPDVVDYSASDGLLVLPES